MSASAPGEVVSIHRVAVNRGPTESLTEAEVRTNYGIAGDFRSRAGKARQITLIEEEALHAAGRTLGMTVPPGASRRQVMVRGIALNPTLGQRLRVGDLELEVTELADPCENMERAIAPGGRAALGNHGGICARILRGGTLRVGDPVTAVVPELAGAAR
jgi:MOSC domain-containing protein YiiM